MKTNTNTNALLIVGIALAVLAFAGRAQALETHTTGFQSYILSRISVGVEPRPFPTQTIKRCKIIDGKWLERQTDILGVATLHSDSLQLEGTSIPGLAAQVKGVPRPGDFSRFATYDNYWVELPGALTPILIRSVLRPRDGSAAEVRQDESDAAKHLVMLMVANCL